MSESTPIFNPNLIAPEIHASLPQGYTIRPLARDDYAKGFFDCLESLTWTGNVTEARFQERFDWMLTKGADWFYNIVIEHQGRIVGNGVLIAERKFIWDLGMVGHIEEISVRKEYQGKGLGKIMIAALDTVGQNLNCNKTLLDCSPDKEAFYEKCGYTANGGIHMSRKMGPTKEDAPTGE